jgi:hypothetical protein
MFARVRRSDLVLTVVASAGLVAGPALTIVRLSTLPGLCLSAWTSRREWPLWSREHVARYLRSWTGRISRLRS